MLKYMIRLYKRFKYFRVESKKKQVLGRWNLLKCDKALERRIALANTDHCGPCSYEEIETPKGVPHNK